MTIEEKAKAYDEVREKIAIRFGSNVANEIFLQFEISEDEKIRKAIINVFATHKDYEIFFGVSAKDIIIWLEKQGKNNMGISSTTKQKLEESLNNALAVETGESLNEFLDKQKPANKVEPKFKKGDVIRRKDGDGLEWIVEDVHKNGYYTIVNSDRDDFIYLDDNWEIINQKVEPKFKVGDWVIGRATNNEPRQIAEIKGGGYKTTYGEWIGFSFEEDMRLWTIQDAKDGDVLVDEYNNIGIYKEIEDICWNSYIYLSCDNSLYGFSIGGSHVQNNTKPATKEQRDLLFQNMKKAGYKWDTEKKELNKI